MSKGEDYISVERSRFLRVWNVWTENVLLKYFCKADEEKSMVLQSETEMKQLKCLVD